jgi:hypothetical protein
MRGLIRWAATSALLVAFAMSIGCESTPPKPAAPPPEAPKPPPPPPPPPANVDGSAVDARKKMVAPTDGLSLADRIAKRQAEEKKLAEQLAGDEKKRLMTYDKTKLPLHLQTFAAIKKFRSAYDKAKTPEDVGKIQGKQEKDIIAAGKKMATIDPKGGNSNVTTDYDVMLNALANDFPAALSASFAGDKKGLEEQNAELDRRSKKIETYLAELKTFKK